jgi:hypothetical protein
MTASAPKARTGRSRVYPPEYRYLFEGTCSVDDCSAVMTLTGPWSDADTYDSPRIPRRPYYRSWWKEGAQLNGLMGNGWFYQHHYEGSGDGWIHSDVKLLFCPDHAPAWIDYVHAKIEWNKSKRRSRKAWWCSMPAALRAFSRFYYANPEPKPPYELPAPE